MDIMIKSCNGYRITYMGKDNINIPEYTIKAGEPFYVHEDDIADVLGNISPEDKCHLIYEEVFLRKEK